LIFQGFFRFLERNIEIQKWRYKIAISPQFRDLNSVGAEYQPPKAHGKEKSVCLFLLPPISRKNTNNTLKNQEKALK